MSQLSVPVSLIKKTTSNIASRLIQDVSKNVREIQHQHLVQVQDEPAKNVQESRGHYSSLISMPSSLIDVSAKKSTLSPSQSQNVGVFRPALASCS